MITNIAKSAILAALIFCLAAPTVMAQDTLSAPIAQSSGTWTPADASGAGLTFSAVSCAYTRIGNMVFIYGTLTYPVTGNSSNAAISGLPFVLANQNYAPTFGEMTVGGAFNTAFPILTKNSATMTINSFAGGSLKTNALLSGAVIVFNFAYPIS